MTTVPIRRYETEFTLFQLLQWYNNAQGTQRPELMGCCLLPDPEHIYQAADEHYT
jgi:hypothetical protein